MADSTDGRAYAARSLAVSRATKAKKLSETSTTLYEAVGGDQFFETLIDHFYAGVDDDATIRHMYPPDLTESKAHMVGFLIQYWGGPGTYSEQRGHPRLRMRHAPFEIGMAEREAWLHHMLTAIDATVEHYGAAIPEGVSDAMRQYFDNASTHMINVSA